MTETIAEAANKRNEVATEIITFSFVDLKGSQRGGENRGCRRTAVDESTGGQTQVVNETLRTSDEGNRHPEGFSEPSNVDKAALPYPEMARGAASPVAKRHHRARLRAQYSDPVGVVDVDSCSIPLGERGERAERCHPPAERVDPVTHDDVIPHGPWDWSSRSSATGSL